MFKCHIVGQIHSIRLQMYDYYLYILHLQSKCSAFICDYLAIESLLALSFVSANYKKNIVFNYLVVMALAEQLMCRGFAVDSIKTTLFTSSQKKYFFPFNHIRPRQSSLLSAKFPNTKKNLAFKWHYCLRFPLHFMMHCSHNCAFAAGIQEPQRENWIEARLLWSIFHHGWFSKDFAFLLLMVLNLIIFFPLYCTEGAGCQCSGNEFFNFWDDSVKCLLSLMLGAISY